MAYRRHRRTPSFHVKQGQLSDMPPQTPVTDHQWCCCRERDKITFREHQRGPLLEHQHFLHKLKLPSAHSNRVTINSILYIRMTVWGGSNMYKRAMQ